MQNLVLKSDSCLPPTPVCSYLRISSNDDPAPSDHNLGLTVRGLLVLLSFAISQLFAQSIELAHTPLASDPNLVSYYRFEGNSNDSKGPNNGTAVNVAYGPVYGMFGQGAHFSGIPTRTGPLELSQTPLASDSNLVSYYRFEGNSNDSKGSNNGSDISMTYGPGSGKFGQGAHFDGISSHIQKLGPTGLPTGNHDLSFTVWIKPSVGTAVVGGFGTASPAEYASFGFDASIYWGGFNNDANVSFSHSADNWYLLTATYAAADQTVRFYVNGSQQGTTRTISTPNVVLTSLDIGFQYWLPTTFYAEEMDDFAIFSRVLTPTEISNLYTGNWSPAGGIQVINPTGLPTGNHDLSFTAWVKPLSVNDFVVGGFGTASPGEYINLSGNSSHSKLSLDEYQFDLDFTASFSAFVWNFVAATYTASDNTVRMYLNGNQVDSTKINLAPNIVLSSLDIGLEYFLPSTLWAEDLDDFAIFSRVLTPAEISNLYTGNWPTTTGTISVTTNLATATFTITGPATYQGGGTSFTQTNAPVGTYTITYGSAPGQIAPPGQTQSLSVGGTTVFSANYQTLPATKMTAVYGQPGGSPQNSSPSFAEPVNTATGNYYATRADLTVPGKGLSLIFVRSYNSADPYSGPVGIGWTHSFNLVLVQNSDNSVNIKEGDGGVISFTPVSAGNYTSATPGVFDKLAKNSDGSFSLTRKNQTQLNFSSLGKLLSIIDRNGNTQSLGYDGLGNLTRITDSSLRSYTLAYDANDRLVLVTDPIGRTLQYAYDTPGRLISLRDPAGAITTYAYDGNSRLISATDPRGNVYLQNTYDSQGRVVTQKNALNFTTTFAYNTPSTGTTTITDPLGNVTKQTADSSLRLIQEINATGGTTTYTYNVNNLKTTVSDPLGRVQSFGYDANGNTTSSTGPNGKTSTFTYDTKNNLLTITDRLGRTTVFAYDAKSNLLTITDPAANTSTFTYDTFGQVLTAKNARNFTTSFQYDSAGNLTKTTDPLGGSVTLAYDGLGRLTSVQNQLGKTASRTYDADNRLLTVTDPMSNTNQFVYDANGNLARITDANGKQTQYTYDATNKLSKVTDANGGLTQYQYNGNTDLTAVTDAAGHTTTYTYDGLRRLTITTDPLGPQKRYNYDAVGDVTSTVDGNGKTNTFGYDVLSRLTSMALSDGKTVGYTYDAVGNRLTMADWHGTTSYLSDLLTRVTSITTPDGKTVGYSYDAVGNRATLTYPDGRAVQYTYDGLNRLATVTDWAAKTTTYSYDAASNLSAFALPNGAASAYTYDPANRLLSVVNRSGANVLSSFTYALDKVGNRLQVTSAAGGVTNYGYDKLYRLTSWTPSSGQVTQYSYDAVGNRLSLISAAGTTNYAYDAADQLLSAGTTTFTYDGNGNQLTKTLGSTTTNYGWDAPNRLISVSGGGANSTYQYDGDGNRVTQQVPAGVYGYTNDTVTSLPVVLNENGPDGVIDYAYGLSQVSETSSTFQYFHQADGLGSTSNLTDPTGALKVNYAYDPWGKLTSIDTLGTKNKYKFTGEALDPIDGLLFLRARYYDPSVGRFISRDPLLGLIELPSSRNRYQYTLSNPVTLEDPSGLTSIDGNPNGGRVLGAYTDSSNQSGSTLANNSLIALSEGGPFFPAVLEEYLKSLGADLAAKIADALGHRTTGQLIRDVNTLSTPFAPDLGDAPRRVGNATGNATYQGGNAFFRFYDRLCPSNSFCTISFPSLDNSTP